MDSHIGVIPATTAVVTFVEISLNQVLAVGIESSVYLFDSNEGENICRVNHFPSQVLAAVWHPEKTSLISGDSNGDLLETLLPSNTTHKATLKPGFVSLSFNILTKTLFVLYKDQVLVLDSGFKCIGEVSTGGFKLVLDYFCPWKLTLIYPKGVKCFNDWSKPAKRKGKLKKIQDAVKNPSSLNNIFILTSSQLLDYDTYSLRVNRVLNSFAKPMTKILSGPSSELWLYGDSTIISPANTLIPVQGQVFPGPWTHDEKLTICLVKPNLSISFGLLTDTVRIKAAVQLGIGLELWNFAFIDEKVLVFYSKPFIMCFSFSKERIVRKVRVADVDGLTCALGSCFYMEDRQRVVEWKLGCGEIVEVYEYKERVQSILVNKQTSFLAVAAEGFVDIFEIGKTAEEVQKIPICGVKVMSWSEDDCYLFVCTSNQVIKIAQNFEGTFEPEVLVTCQLSVREIIEVSGELFIENNESWFKLTQSSCKLVPELIEKVDEINIGNSKADFKSFGLQYRDTPKQSEKLFGCHIPRAQPPTYRSFLAQSSPQPLPLPLSLTHRLLEASASSNSSKHFLFFKLLKEIIESPADDADESMQDKPRIPAKDRSLYSSPGNITPTRRPVKRSVSPLNKSRKSITPSRIQKMQSDPKDLIQLAVDTSSLLSSTQNFPKDSAPRPYYVLDNQAPARGSISSPSDFLTSDKKTLVGRLLASNDQTDLLLACTLAGTLGRQELQKAIETCCSKLAGFAGVVVNLSNGSRGKAFELLLNEGAQSEVAYCSKVSGKFDEFFAYVIKLFEEKCEFLAAVQLLAAGFHALALQLLAKAGEEELAAVTGRVLEVVKNRKEVPSEFEHWFYELGAPRFRSRAEEDVQGLVEKILKSN